MHRVLETIWLTNQYAARNQSIAVMAFRSSVADRSPNPNPFVLLHLTSRRASSVPLCSRFILVEIVLRIYLSTLERIVLKTIVLVAGREIIWANKLIVNRLVMLA